MVEAAAGIAHTPVRVLGASTLLDMPYRRYLCILDLVGSERDTGSFQYSLLQPVMHCPSNSECLHTYCD